MMRQRRKVLFLSTKKYDQIVESLRRHKTVKKKGQFMKNCWNRYALNTNVKHNLFCKVTKKSSH